MIKFYRAIQYFTTVGYDHKRLLILMLLSFVLPFLGFGLCGAYDYPPDQLDLYRSSINHALSYYLLGLFPILIILILNLFHSANLATSYRTSQDYTCLVGTLSRATILFSKSTAAIMASLAFLLLYFISAQSISMIYSINLFDWEVIVAIAKIIFNVIVCISLTTLSGIMTRSAFSGLISPLLYIWAIIVHNIGVHNNSLLFVRKFINWVLPVYRFNFAEGQSNTGIGEASIALSIGFGLAYIIICSGLACLIYSKQDL